MIGRDPWLCSACCERHANACPKLWGGDFVAAPPAITFADLRIVYSLAREITADVRVAWRELIDMYRQDINRRHFQKR